MPLLYCHRVLRGAIRNAEQHLSHNDYVADDHKVRNKELDLNLTAYFMHVEVEIKAGINGLLAAEEIAKVGLEALG
jgi:hypothetical protein